MSWPVRDASFVERYMQADMYLAIWRRGGGRYKHGFLVKVAPVLQRDRTFPIKGYTTRKREHIEQTTVFSGEVQIMEGAKKFVPSRIWPQTFDDDLIDLGKPLYLFQDLALGVQEVGLCPPKSGNRCLWIPGSRCVRRAHRRVGRGCCRCCG